MPVFSGSLFVIKSLTSHYGPWRWGQDTPQSQMQTPAYKPDSSKQDTDEFRGRTWSKGTHWTPISMHSRAIPNALAQQGPSQPGKFLIFPNQMEMFPPRQHLLCFLLTELITSVCLISHLLTSFILIYGAPTMVEALEIQGKIWKKNFLLLENL